MVSKLTIVLGEGAYVNNPDELIKLSDTSFARPDVDPPKDKILEIIGEEKVEFEDTEAEPDPEELAEEAGFNFAAYSVSGWFKWEPIEERKPCHVVFRLTNNEPDYLKDA
jgi:hypothetical protein